MFRQSLVNSVMLLLCCTLGADARTPPGDNVQVKLSKTYNSRDGLEKWEFPHFYMPGPRLEDPRFKDLVRTDAQKAIDLERAGLVLGKYVGERPVPHDAIEFLIRAGCPNPNLHITATVRLMEEGTDDTGYWCRLVTVDPYWTNRYNCITYDFAIHIANDGVIRLMNPVHVGPKTPEES